MTDREYEAREAQEFHRQLREVEKAPLADRKEAAADFLRAMREIPETVGERVGWLIAGNYGKGAHDAARRVLKSPRMNRAAWLVQTVAALEWQCPQRAAAEAWKKLTAAEKAALDRAVEKEIRDFEAEEG